MRDSLHQLLDGQPNVDLVLLERLETAIRLLGRIQHERDQANETVDNQRTLLQQYSDLLDTHRESLKEHRELSKTQAELLISKDRMIKRALAVASANRQLMDALITARKVCMSNFPGASPSLCLYLLSGVCVEVYFVAYF